MSNIFYRKCVIKKNILRNFSCIFFPEIRVFFKTRSLGLIKAEQQNEEEVIDD